MAKSDSFSVQTIFKAWDKFTPVVKTMGSGVHKFVKASKKELGELEDITGKLSGGINKVATALTGIAVTAGASLAAAAKPGMDFEQQMADLGASFLKTRDQIAPLEKEALRLGAATKFSATEVAGAMESMSKAGFSEEQALSGVAGMTYAAAAAGEDLIETTANVSSVMKGMQIDVGNSAKVADILALASVKTASSIGSLAESLSKAGPVAKQFNVGLEDVTSMVALLQDAGIDASEAGSAVATMLTKLATPSKQAKEQMRKLGVSFEDTAGNMKKPSEVLGEFAKASKKSGGNMKQAAFFAEMLGLRGQKAGLLLQEAFKNGKYAGLVDDLKKAEGTAQKMADLRMNTLTGDIDVLTENVKGLGIELFSMNSGPLRDVVKSMTSWLDKNKADVLQKLQDGVKWFVDNLPTIVTWTKRLAIAWAVFNTASLTIKTAQMAIAGYEATLKLATAAQWAFGASAKVWSYTTTGIGKAAQVVGLFDTNVSAAGKGLAGWRDALNSGGLSKQINGVNSLLGKAGLLGTAALVGYEFGKWLNDTFELDKSISGLIEKMTGLDDKLKGRDAKGPGLDPAGDRIFADGSIQAADGTWKKKSKARQARESKLGSEWKNEHRGSSPLLAPAYASGGASPLMVSPQERMSIQRSESTTKAEVVIRDDSGKAEVTKQPKGKGFTLKLKPTGAF